MLSSKIIKHTQDRGFTLIELLVVISIISLLASIVLASLNSARDKAKVARAAADLKQLVLVLNFYLDGPNGNGAYPCFDHTWDDTKEKAWSAPYIPVWPTPPWGNTYHWEHGSFTVVSNGRSISINAPGQANADALDKAMDNSNGLGAGVIAGSGGRLEYGGMDQSVPFVDCHI